MPELDKLINLLRPNCILRSSFFPEPVSVIAVISLGASIKVQARGLQSGQLYSPILSREQLQMLEISPVTAPFDGDAVRFRLGIEALRLGLAYEYDPYFRFPSPG